MNPAEPPAPDPRDELDDSDADEPLLATDDFFFGGIGEPLQ